MIEPVEQLHAVLRRHKQNATGPRLAIFQALQQNEPLTMKQLVKACGEAVDRSSVYRTVALFERLGIVQRLQIGWKHRIELSNTFQHHHHHLYCTGCGSVTVIPEDDVLESRVHALATQKGFHASDHQIEIRGLCESCQSKRPG